MNAEAYLKELMELKSGSIKSFALEIDIPYTTVHSILKRGVLNSNMGNVLKICEGLGITPEHLASFDKPPDKTIEKNKNPHIVIAAHMDDDLSEEEMQEVRDFINFVKSKRK